MDFRSNHRCFIWFLPRKTMGHVFFNQETTLFLLIGHPNAYRDASSAARLPEAAANLAEESRGRVGQLQSEVSLGVAGWGGEESVVCISLF